jgi:aminopeptidase N
MAQAKTTFLRDYKPPAFLIKTVNLHFTLDENLTRVRSHLTLSRNPQGELQHDLTLQGENLELMAIQLNEHHLASREYQLYAEQLVIFNVPCEFTLTIETQIRPRENTALSGLYVSRSIFCTQCEAEGFRRITYFIDRPDVLARYTTTIVADKTHYPVLLSNGNKIAYQDLADNQHSVTWEDPCKKPSYLFALVAGNLAFIQDEFITQSQQKVILQIFFEKGQKEKCYHAMDSLKKAMRWDEQAYGREYDLAIFMIAVIDDFNMGAMENKGLNIFNAQTVLADAKTATDADYSYVTKVVGHEYFHNWTGDRITCRDWFQLSLKEGLTVFREQEFSETTGFAVVERINTVRHLRSLQFAEDAGPLAHPVQPDSYIEINNFYTMTVYEKGAELIRMMKILVGAELFRKGMDEYFARYDGQAVTIDDFIKTIAEASGYDLQQFHFWYKQAGTPQLEVTYAYDPEVRIFDLYIKQSCPPTPGQPKKQAFYIPLVMALLNQQGHTIPLQLEGEAKDIGQQRVLIVKEKEHHFRFMNVENRVLPSLLRNFSAPIKLNVNYSDEDLAFLLQKDNDGFNRWDAAQRLASRIVLQKQGSQQATGLLIKAYETLIMSRRHEDEALLAELLNLPSETYFAEQMAIIDVEGIHYRRAGLRHQIAESLREQLLKLYENYQDFKPYQFNAGAQAKRRLKNTCLSYVMLLSGPLTHDLGITQYEKADNMTDRLSALSELVNNSSPESARCLGDFYARWKSDSLVICKWLSVQARSPLSNTLEQVKELLRHPAFDWKNPNKIRALIGVFCAENQIQFHQPSGAAYRFLGEQVLYLDKLNPQIAARLLRPLTRWQRFDSTRCELMREQLEQIVKVSNLSPDVYEIASKSLDCKNLSG